MKVYDAVIVGAGPAGGFAAWKLASAGFQVLILDQHSSLPRKVCGEYLCPRGVQLLRGEDLHELVPNHRPIRGIHLHSGYGRSVRTDFPGEKNWGVTLNRLEFDSQLLRRGEQAGAEVSLGARFCAAHERGDLWVVETQHQSILARLLIGADGRYSRVSHFLKNENRQHGRHSRVALHCHLHSIQQVKRWGEMHLFSDGAYAGINPTADHQINFSLVCDSQTLKKVGGARAAIEHYVKQSQDLKSRFELPEAFHVQAVHPLQHRVRTVLPHPRAALIGDAGGFIDPLTGEGVFHALLSSQLLSRELILAKTLRQSFSEALALYAKAHRNEFRQKLLLNASFQFVIRRPWLVEGIAKFLLTSKTRADAFIGIVGNVHSPLRGLWQML